MSAIFQLNGNNIVPAPGQKIIKADEAALFLKAQDLVQAWSEKQAVLEMEMENDYQEKIKEGFEEGKNEGLTEYTLKIMDTVMGQVEYLESMESDLVKMISEAVRKIIGDMDHNELIIKLVKKALASLRSDRRITVRICPTEEAAVRRDLIQTENLNANAYLEVKSDPRLNPGECILENDMGRVVANLETQLKNLELALSSHIKK